MNMTFSLAALMFGEKFVRFIRKDGRGGGLRDNMNMKTPVPAKIPVLTLHHTSITSGVSM